VLEGFAFGGALLAMFMRVGGGIFTKAADVGADLVGKVEQGIPEDDPRNAATIADNVGDNVGDCAGMAADLFESYAVTLVAALILGQVAFGEQGLVFPLIVPAIGVITALVGIYGTSPRDSDKNGMNAINRGFFLSAVVSAVLVAIAGVPLPARDLRRAHRRHRVRRQPALVAIGAVIIGIVLASLIQVLTGYFTETDRKPVREIGKSSLTGPATVILAGISVGLESAGLLGAAHRWRGLRGVPARRRLDRRRAVRRRARRHRPAHHRRRHRRDGHLRPDQRQRAGHRRDVRRGHRGGRARPHQPRRRRQHHQGHHQGHRDRHAVLAATGAVRVVPRRGRPGARGRGRQRRRLHAVDREAEPAVRPDHRRGRGVPVLRPRDPGGVPRRRPRGVRGARAVPHQARDHGLHREARLRPRRRHLHQGLAARAGHPRPAGGPVADRGRLRARLPAARRVPRRRHRGRRAHGGVPVQLRWAWDNAKKLVEDGTHGGKGSPAHEATIIGDTSATRSRTPRARPSTR
jgi:uncharacterized membrane protein